MSLKTHRTSFQMLVQKIMYHFVHTVLIYFKLRMAKKFTKRKKIYDIHKKKHSFIHLTVETESTSRVTLLLYILNS